MPERMVTVEQLKNFGVTFSYSDALEMIEGRHAACDNVMIGQKVAGTWFDS